MRTKVILVVAGLLVALPSGEAAAQTRELKQGELRKATLTGGTIRLKRVIKGVEKAYGGTPVDARAFQADQIYYRILVKKPDGKIVSVIVNAQTGTVVSNRSSVGRQISKVARSNSANANNSRKANSNRGASASGGNNGTSGGNAGGNGGGNGNGNGGGNGNGNGGGNGGGNSGGNGGGNSGGNGGGNSGGNGGGNSGGNGGGNSGGNGKGNGKK